VVFHFNAIHDCGLAIGLCALAIHAAGSLAEPLPLVVIWLCKNGYSSLLVYGLEC